MTLRDELWDLVEHTPEGMTTVTIKVDWLRRQLEEAGGSEAAEASEETASYLTTSEAARSLSVEPETIARWCRDDRFAGSFKTDPDGETGEWRIPVEDVRKMKRRESSNERHHFKRN